MEQKEAEKEVIHDITKCVIFSVVGMFLGAVVYASGFLLLSIISVIPLALGSDSAGFV